MQVQGTPGAQTEFVTGVKNNDMNAAGVQQQNKQETGVQWEQKETYQPSEDALLKFYYEQMKSEQEKAAANKDEQADIAKLMRIAQNIMRGKQVPSKDESYLVKHNLSLYMAAKNIGSLRKPSGRAKSVLGGNRQTGAGSSGSVTAENSSAGESIKLEAAGSGTVENTVPETAEEVTNSTAEAVMKTANDSSGTKTARREFDASKYQTESERNYRTDSTYSSSGTKKARAKKKYKKFHYYFKSVSSQIVRAKTSMGARQAAGRALRQTVDLRRKLVSGEYDRTYVRIALTHAEAIERVAKKKVRHLLEEERIKRGGPCSGDNDKFDKEEQQRLDEQADMEMWDNFRNGDIGAESDGENLEELFAAAVQQSAPVPEVSIDMDELMMEFEELMKTSMEAAAASLDDLTEELSGDAGVDMDPEDLKLLKIKHRTKEQQEIAAADARYLRAFFEQLQKDQQQTAAAISQIAEAAADMPVIQVADTGGGRSAATAVETASSGSMVNAEPVKTDAAPEIAVSSGDMKANVGGGAGSPSVSIDGVSFDVSI